LVGDASKSEERQSNAAKKVDRTLDCTKIWIRADVSSGSMLSKKSTARAVEAWLSV